MEPSKNTNTEPTAVFITALAEGPNHAHIISAAAIQQAVEAYSFAVHFKLAAKISGIEIAAVLSSIPKANGIYETLVVIPQFLLHYVQMSGGIISAVLVEDADIIEEAKQKAIKDILE